MNEARVNRAVVNEARVNRAIINEVSRPCNLDPKNTKMSIWVTGDDPKCRCPRGSAVFRNILLKIGPDVSRMMDLVVKKVADKNLITSVDIIFLSVRQKDKWEHYQVRKYGGKMLVRLIIFSMGSYLKLDEFDHEKELSDDIISIYTNDNRLYDFFKDKELLGYGDIKNISDICNFQKVMLFGYAFIKGRALEIGQKEDIPLLILDFIKNNINDKKLIVNIIINAIISSLYQVEH